jgi:phage minor structural protein, N-terminal region
MIVLHKSNETDFTHNGIGLLDAHMYEAVVEETFNGLYSFTFKYPLFALHGSEIQGERLINVPTPDGMQLFRIYKVEPSMGELTVSCFHVFYDLAYNLIEDAYVVNSSGQTALNHLFNSTQFAHPFRVFSNIPKINNMRIVRYNVVEMLLDSNQDNSFINRWGGEIRRDNFAIHFNELRGTNRGVTIRHKKDLEGYTATIDYSSVVTRIMPQGFDGLFLPEKYVDSPLIGNYVTPKIAVIEYSDIKAYELDEDGKEIVPKDDEETDAIPREEAFKLMRERAELEFEVSMIDIPKANYKISFIDLAKTEEYKDFQILEKIGAWDFVRVIHEEDGLDIESRVVRYQYNPLNQEYISIELGNDLASFTGNSNDMKGQINDLNNGLSDLNDNLNYVQQSADGKNTIFRGKDTPQNPSEGDLWYYPNGEYLEVWVYEDGRWVLLLSDATGQLIKDEVDREMAELEAEMAEANRVLTVELEANSKLLETARQNVSEVQNIMDNWEYGDTVQIDGGKIYAKSITTQQLRAGLITSLEIQAGAVVADKLATNSVTSNSIVSSAITTDKLSANSVNTSKIVAGAITAEKMSANSVNAASALFGTLDVNRVNVINMNAGNIVTGTMNAARVRGGTIEGTDFRTTGQSQADGYGSGIEQNAHLTGGRIDVHGNGQRLISYHSRGLSLFDPSQSNRMSGMIGRVSASATNPSSTTGTNVGAMFNYHCQLATRSNSTATNPFNPRFRAWGNNTEAQIWGQRLMGGATLGGHTQYGDTVFDGEGTVTIDKDKSIALRNIETTGYDETSKLGVTTLKVDGSLGTLLSNDAKNPKNGVWFSESGLKLLVNGELLDLGKLGELLNGK